MEFVSYTHWNQLPESADALFSQYEKESIFFSRLWFDNLHKTTLEDGQSLLFVCVLEGDSVLAILPLMMRESGYWHSFSNYNSSLFNLLLADDNQGDQQATLDCLVQGLNQLPFVQLKLEPIAENDKNMKNLQGVMESSNFTCLHSFRFFNWFHRVEGQSFDEYMASLSGKVRNTVMRKQRKLEREHGYDIRLYIDDDISQAMADYNTIYHESWKGTERFTGFVEGLVRRLSTRGWLRFAVLYIDKKPVAAQIWFVAHGKANIFRLVYDLNWKQYSPGSILTQYLMKHVIDVDKVEEIDFLTGNEPYKKDWMSKSRKRWGMICAKNPEPPKHKVNQLFDALKGLLRFTAKN